MGTNDPRGDRERCHGASFRFLRSGASGENRAVVLDHFTDVQKRAYILADNKLALNAGWEDLLKEEGFAVETIGFDDEALAALLGEHTSLPDPDSPPAILPVPGAATGDVDALRKGIYD